MIRPWRRIEEWRVHIGAHKTATTHLQDTLALERQRLNEQGVDYVSRSELRPLTRVLFSKRLPAHRLDRSLRSRVLELGLRGRLPGEAHRVVLSEENFLGGCAGLMEPTLYGDMERRISLLNRLGLRARLTLFLSIRSFDRVLPGAYLTALRFNPNYVDILSRVVEAAERNPPSWLPLINRIARITPDARLRLWRQEDYREHEGWIINRLLGTEGIAFRDIPPPPSTRTPGLEAVTALEAEAREADPGMSRARWAARSQAVLSSFDQQEDGNLFQPFSERLVALMRERYAADCDEIRRCYGGALIAPAKD